MRAGFTRFNATTVKQSRFICMLLSAVLMVTTASHTCAQPVGKEGRAGVDDEIAGLLVNQTLMANGQEFYRDFAAIWQEKPDAEKYTLDIIELPSKRFGNQIWILHGRRRVFTGVLPLKFDRVRAMSEQAAETVYADIISFGMQQSLELDLGVDEL